MMTPAYRKLRHVWQKAEPEGQRLLHQGVACVLIWAYDQDMVGHVPRLEVLRLGFEMDDSEWDITMTTMVEYMRTAMERRGQPGQTQWAKDCSDWIQELDSVRAFT